MVTMQIAGVFVAVVVMILAGKATAKECEGGHSCSPPKECCTLGCCYNYPPPAFRPPTTATASYISLVFWNSWCFWFVVAVSLLSCVGGCCLWRRRHCCCRGRRREDPGSERDSTGSCYLPPQYSRCSSFHHAPPPYTEVTSKPDLYPLVISYNDQGKTGSHGGVGGNYLMVQYFRNYLVRPMTSLSATSDSLSSSFLYATNEANTQIPPPYSCAGSLEDFPECPPRSVSSTFPQPERQGSPADGTTASSCHPHPRPPRSLSLQPSFVSAAALSTTGSDVSSLAGVGTPDSPPRATSPTSEIRELLDKIQQLPMSDEALHEPARAAQRERARRQYAPIAHRAPPMSSSSRSRHRCWLPRSAPTTPSGGAPTSLLRTSASSGRQGDGSPLLEDRGSDDDHSDEML